MLTFHLTNSIGMPLVKLRAALRLLSRHACLRLASACLSITVIALIIAHTLHADSLDERFLAGLRQRRLFTLAEKYCIDELEASDLAPDRRTALAIELVQTYAEHALYAPLGERRQYWDDAHATAAAFLDNVPANAPGRRRAELLMQIQDALAHLSQGELLRQEVQADLGDASRLEAAKTTLRKAISGLEEAKQDIDVALREVGLGKVPQGELSSDQLASLERNVSFQLARTLKNQGLCYPTDSPDRANSLSQAVELLAPLAELQAADETIWRSRIELIVCQRLLRQFQPATQSLAQLIAAQPGPQYLLRAMAEKIRLDLDQAQLDAALASMQQGRTSAGQASAELDFAHLETMIAAWAAATKAGHKAEAASWQQRATTQVQLLERDHGAYWMRRAETLLASMVAGSGDGNVAALRRAAESYYRGSRFEEAMQTYDRAALLAAQSGNADEAFALAFTAASIEHARGEAAAALDRFQQLAERMPEQSRAGEAHLLAIVNASQLAQAATGAAQTEQIKAYKSLLQKQLAAWPHDASTDQARLWLGKLLEARREWLPAFTVYREVAADRPQFEEAMRGALRCAEQEIKTSATAGRFDSKFFAEAVRFGEELIVGTDRRWPEKWSPLQLESALIVARLYLSYHQGEVKNIEPAASVLQAALTANTNAPAEWQADARLLLVWALASLDNSAEAAAQLDQMTGGMTASLLTVLQKLDGLAAAADAKRERDLAQLAIHLARQLDKRAAELNESQRRQFQSLQAAALVRGGYFGDALKLYQQLVEKYPRDGKIQEAHAGLLARATDAASQRVALAKWREVESKTKAGDPRWFRARLAQAELLLKLNDQPAATKLIQLTAVLHPELGGAETKAKFEALLKAAGR